MIPLVAKGTCKKYGLNMSRIFGRTFTYPWFWIIITVTVYANEASFEFVKKLHEYTVLSNLRILIHQYVAVLK